MGELLRVRKPAGKIGLVNLTPDGFIGQLVKTVGKYPPAAGPEAAPAVGYRGAAARALRRGGLHPRGARGARSPGRYPSAKAFVENFRDYYGPTLKAFAALESEGQNEALAGTSRNAS